MTVHREQNMKREDQQDATIRCLLLACLNMFRASLCPSSGEQRPCYCIWCVLVLLDLVGSGCGALSCRMWAHSARQRPTTATNHIQQNQNNTPNAVTGPLFSWRWAQWCPKHVETDVNNKHLIVVSCWSSLFICCENRSGSNVPRIAFIGKL